MPDLTVVITATATEKGKTWLGAQLARLLARRHVPVAARKPVQSFDPGDPITDAQLLAAATGEDPEMICPAHRWYPLAMAPPLAADALGRDRIGLGGLVEEIALPKRGIVLVEGVGGPRSPIAHDGDTVALAAVLNADVVIVVSDANLGAINAALLSVEAFGGRDALVFLNHFERDDPLHAANREWLSERAKLDVFTTPHDLVARLVDRLSLEDRCLAP